jgi:hypothetical protein
MSFPQDISTTFDDGTAQGWTAVTAGAGTATIIAGAAHDGSFGAQGSVPAATVDIANFKRSVGPAPAITIKGWWRVTTEGANGSNVPFARLFYGTQRLADVYRANAVGGNNVWLRVVKAAGGSNYWFIGAAFTLALNTWVYVEFTWNINGTPTLKLNGTTYLSSANKPADWFSAPQIDTAYLGSQEVGNQGVWNIDTISVTAPVDGGLSLANTQVEYYQKTLGPTSGSRADLYYKFLQAKTSKTNLSTEDMEEIYWNTVAGTSGLSVQDAKRIAFGSANQYEELYWLRAQP